MLVNYVLNLHVGVSITSSDAVHEFDSVGLVFGYGALFVHSKVRHINIDVRFKGMMS